MSPGIVNGPSSAGGTTPPPPDDRTLPPPAHRVRRVAAPPPGWFGKLASRGDFLRRRLPDPWVDRVDRWLSAALESSRLELGEQWLDTYLSAALVRWIFGPGIVDTRWWFGVMMPSCDNVGRYYPLMVAQSCATAPGSPDEWAALEAWWTDVAEAMLETLADHSSVESFETRLARLSPLICPAAAAAQVQPAGSGRWRLSGAPSMSAWLPELATIEWRGRLANASLWWPMAAEGDGRVMVTPGLPTQGLLTRLLQPGE